MKRSCPKIIRTVMALLALSSLFISLTLVVPARPNMPGKKQLKVPAEKAPEESKMRVSKAYGNLPMSFEPNRGQTDRRVKFLSRGSGYTLFLTQSEATLALYKNEEKSDSTSRTHHSSLGSVV